LSKKIQFPLVALISLVGLGDALYLTVKHYSGEAVRCTVTSGCDEVLSSRFATVAGIPVSLIGLVAYFTVFSLAVLAAFSYPIVDKLLMILAVAMLASTAWLMYVQAFELQHFCQYCLLSAVATILLAGLTLGAPLLFKRGGDHETDPSSW
jgi:uncharacterized membrane protein